MCASVVRGSGAVELEWLCRSLLGLPHRGHRRRAAAWATEGIRRISRKRGAQFWHSVIMMLCEEARGKHEEKRTALSLMTAAFHEQTADKQSEEAGAILEVAASTSGQEVVACARRVLFTIGGARKEEILEAEGGRLRGRLQRAAAASVAMSSQAVGARDEAQALLSELAPQV